MRRDTCWAGSVWSAGRTRVGRASDQVHRDLGTVPTPSTGTSFRSRERPRTTSPRPNRTPPGEETPGQRRNALCPRQDSNLRHPLWARMPTTPRDEAAASLSAASWDGRLGDALKPPATRWTDHQCEALHTTYRDLGRKTWDTWSAYTGAERVTRRRSTARTPTSAPLSADARAADVEPSQPTGSPP